MAIKPIAAGLSTAYRGPVRKRRILFGTSNNTPIPIAQFAARIRPQTGIVARFSPDTKTAYKKFDLKTAGAF